LIEINSVPALFFTKTVVDLITAKLLDDVLKVVVDQTSDPSAYVGDFELIHTEEINDESNTADLIVKGKKVERTFDRASLRETIMRIQENAAISPLNEKKIEYETNDGTKFIYIKEKA
jgi:galactitol-specific phosphotransferase system IIB component